MRRLGLFGVGSVAFWLVVAIPSRYLLGDAAVVCFSTALGLCFVPTALTLFWSAWAFERSPEQQLTAVLGGTTVRLFVVLAGALALYKLVPYFQEQSGFWTWLLVAYLFTLALEVVLVVTGRTVAAAVQQDTMSGPSA